MSASRWRAARNILCVRLDGLSGVLMCTPAFRALRESLPGRRLTLLTSPSGAALRAHLSDLDEVIDYAAPWTGQAAGRADAPEIAARLRARRFDGAVIFTCFNESPLPAALLLHQAGVPLRLAHCREHPHALLTDWVKETEPAEGIRHEVRRQLDLVAQAGAYSDNEALSFRLHGADITAVRARLAARGISQPFVLMHPGAGAASRRWPARHWSRAVELVYHELGHQVVLTGLAGEAALVRDILARAQVPPGAALPLAGALGLGELGAAIALAMAVLSTNSAPAHLSAALGTPIVDLYAQTHPQHTPWQVPQRLLFHDVPCRNCLRSECPEGHHACLDEVEPEQAVAAIRDLMEQGGDPFGFSAPAPRAVVIPLHEAR